MDFKNTRLNLPKLEVVDRNKPEDQIKFRAWKKVMEAHLAALDLSDIVGKEMNVEVKEKLKRKQSKRRDGEAGEG